MHADNDPLAQDALAFSLLALAFSTLADGMAILDASTALGLLKELANGIDAGVATVPSEVRDSFAPEVVASARGRVIEVLQEALRHAASRGAA